MIDQFSHDGIRCKTRVQFVSSHWSVLVSFDPSIVSKTKSVFEAYMYLLLDNKFIIILTYAVKKNNLFKKGEAFMKHHLSNAFVTCKR